MRLAWLATPVLAFLIWPAGAAFAATGRVAVFPIPGSRVATPETQITFRGVPAGQVGAISVTGSSSGAHPGVVEADSDGRGASFLPTAPFTPGEVVTVSTGLNILGATRGTFTFTVQQPAGGIAPPGRRSVPPRVSGDVDYFRSRPDLQPAAVKITQGQPIGNDLFLTPMRGPVQWGPMIVDAAGRLVWFQPLTGSVEQAADLRVQQLNGQPVLTWWEGFQNAGLGKGKDVIFDDHYRQIATVSAGNGLQADLHEFTITPQGTALITAYRLVHWPVGSRSDIAVQDCVVQEIDIPTGLVLFQWDSLDHVSVNDSYSRVPSKKGHPYDYFHLNSVQQATDGSLIVSGRNTWAVYDVDHQSGKIRWTLGGKHSNFKMGRGTSTAYQHHVRSGPGDLFTIFDNGAAPQVHPQSRALIERVDPVKRTATLIKALDHSPKLVSPFEGSVQLLTHGNTFVGWGALPNFTQFGAKGKQIYDGRFVDENSSYRAYRFPWNAQPDTPPALAASPDASGIVHLYASWNGATDVTGWQVLAGPSPNALVPVGRVAKKGFETQIPVPSGEPDFSVQAVGAGKALATSPVQSVPPHVAIFGRSAFVAGGWSGGLPTFCYASQPCHVTATVKAGRTTVGKTAGTIRAGSYAVLHFKLTGRGHAMLMRTRDHRLPVRVSAEAPSTVGGSTSLTLVPFYTGGHAPQRSASQSATLQIVGLTSFVFEGKSGGILVGCQADVPCGVRTTLSVGKTTIARTRAESIGAKQLGYVSFSLTPAGRTMLARAPGNQLGARLTISDGHATATGQIALVRFG